MLGGEESDEPQSLFSPGSGRLNASVDYAKDDIAQYAQGYRTSAERLFENIVERGNFNDEIVLPIAFLWHQYIELTLKLLIELVQRCKGEPVMPPLGHNLGRLWKNLEPSLVEMFPDVPEYETVKHFIEEFERIDPGSDGFRYPGRRDGEQNVMEQPRLVNLEILDSKMRELADFLETEVLAVSNRYDGELERMRERALSGDSLTARASQRPVITALGQGPRFETKHPES